jgi:hypothetical protein
VGVTKAKTLFLRRTVMLYRKTSYLIPVVLAMVLVGIASAANDWTNATGNGRWMDPNNWTIGVPGPGTGNTRINPDTNADPNNLVGPTIGVGEIAITDAMDNWAPEWGLSLNIEGGSLTSAGFVGLVSVGGATNPCEINLGANGSGGWLDLINFLVGDSWWYHGGPYVTYNQWSGTAIIRDYLWLGGKANLYGGTMYIFNGVAMASVGQPPEITTLNIAGGTLMLPLIATADDPATPDDETVTFTEVVQGWIDGGYCVAYGGTGQIVIEETGSRTKVTAIPAPATVTPE